MQSEREARLSERILTVLFTLGVMAFLQGCVAEMVMKSQDRQHYSEYVSETQRLNFEREKAGLPPQKVMTFEEWHGK